MSWLYDPSSFHSSPQYFQENNVNTSNLTKKQSDFQSSFSEIQGNGM